MNQSFAASFDAYVVAALFEKAGAAFVLADGAVRFQDGSAVAAHDGGALCAAVHPSGEGVVTGGDDGRLVWSRPGAEPQVLADLNGKWIDAVETNASTGLIAYAAGRTVGILDAKDKAFARSFQHEHSVAALAFDPKGRKLACATYGGAALWFARIAEQKPQMLRWAGAHIGVIWSPDGRFLVSSMQEAMLHAWRVEDGRDMRMSGYPAKVRSLAFLSKGQLLATSGANGSVVWPFTGPNGPMGKEAAEVGYDQNSLVTRVAANLNQDRLWAGLDNGKVWMAETTGRALVEIRPAGGAPISALAVAPDGRVAWGDEKGEAGVAAT
jgi:WD40 repeat protein